MTERWFRLWFGYTLPPSDDPSAPTGGIIMNYAPLRNFEEIFNNMIEKCPRVDITADVTTLPCQPQIPITWTAVPE